MIQDAFHLPGLGPEDVVSWEVREYGGGHAIRFPRLAPGALRRIAGGLVQARSVALACYDTPAIIAGIDRAAERLADPTDSLRAAADASLPALTGFSEPMLRFALDRMVPDWRTPALQKLVESELPHAEALDRFVPRAAGGRTRAFGPELALHVFAGNVPGVAVTSLVRSLLVKAATIGKTASGEPLLAVLFARSLQEVDPRLGACLAVTYWPGGDPVEEEIFPLADAVVVYGGREAVANARRRAAAHARVLEHGPKFSFALIGADVLAGEIAAGNAARQAALAVATFDQQGCVSPHVVYVEEGAGITPRQFAGLVAQHLGRLEDTLPRGTLAPEESAAIHAARSAAEFRAIAGEDVTMTTGPGTSWTVIYEPDVAFSASCLNRLVRVKPIDRLEAVPVLVAPFRDLLQTVGVAGAGDRLESLATSLAAVGATRVTSLADMPWPPPAWHHDGRGPLGELLRWVDLETESTEPPDGPA